VSTRSLPWANRSGLALALLAAAAAASGGACIKRGYPLGRAGNVEIRPDVAGNLYATDTLDNNGKPSGPRQDPHATGVTLALTDGSQAAYGAYVTVRVDPPQALELESDPYEVTKNNVSTCSATEGSFRCAGTSEGLARFVVTSQSDWAGDAKIVVTWADQTKEQPIHVSPAGLPAAASNFEIVIGGVQSNTHVLATYVPLMCTAGPVPDDLGSKWRPGQIRARQTYVRATPPSASPKVVQNAPVIVDSQNSEAEVATLADCSDRQTRLRTTLDADGQSPPFYLCFSDNGGEIQFGVTSGEKTIDPSPKIIVDPEPRLLSVRALSTHVIVDFAAVDLFEVSAYNADRLRIAVPVDLKAGDDQVLGLINASVTLAAEDNPATIIQVTPLTPGMTELHVSPRLLAMPDCASPTVTVLPPLTGP
jgi:hypothetical protein